MFGAYCRSKKYPAILHPHLFRRLSLRVGWRPCETGRRYRHDVKFGEFLYRKNQKWNGDVYIIYMELYIYIYMYIHRLSLSIIEDITSGCSSSAFVLPLYLSAVSSIEHRAPTALYGGCFTFRWDPSAGSAVQKYAMAMEDPHFLTQPPKCGWVKT